jgi:hypothetical protein
VFTAVGLKFGRARGQFRVHDARHETISALSQSPQFNDAQVKKFTESSPIGRWRATDIWTIWM